MARHIEYLSGGLWTAKDPALLENGQLSYLQNAVYIAGGSKLQRAPGRAVFATASGTATAVEGLRDAKFDNGDHYLIGHVGATYVTALITGAAVTSTFGQLTAGIGSGSQLERIHYRNRFYLLNGTAINATATATNSNVVMYQSATAAATTPSVRQHGMVAVNTPPEVTATAATFSQEVTGYYEYWTTEVAEYTQDGSQILVESSFEAGQGVATQFIPATSVATLIKQPQIINPSATRWRVYRSPKKDLLTDKKFPTGFMIADVATAVTSVVDSTSAASASAFAGNFNGVGDGATVWADFTGASAMSQDDSTSATVTSTSIFNIRQQGIYNFKAGGASGSLGAVAGSIKGIKVEVVAKVDTGTAQVGVSLVRARQSNGGVVPANLPGLPGGLDVFGQLITRRNVATKSFTATTAEATATLGGETDRWFASDHPFPLTDSDVNNQNFMVKLAFADATTTTLSVDFVRVTVYYGATIDSVVVFPTVVYTFGDIIAQVGKNGAPPGAETGDVYEDTLVLNDITNPAVIRYSYPNDPEAFPSTYYLEFETQDNDRVRCIKVVNNRLLVFLDTSTWRVNYLPSERDASFDRGKAKEPISRKLGCVNPMCAAVYSPRDGQERLAFVSHKGVFSTDGFDLQDMTENLDWRGIIALDGTSTPICLIDDPEKECLRFYYRNDNTSEMGQADAYLCLWLHYDGRISGRVHVSNLDTGTGATATLESAWSVPRTNGDTSVFMGYGGTATAAGAGKVYIETGTTIPANDPAYAFITRRMYLNNFGNEWKLSQMHDYGTNSGTPSIRYRLRNVKTNASAESNPDSSQATALAGEPMRRYQFNRMLEGARIQCETSAQHDNDIGREFLVLDGDDFNTEDSGK